MKKKNRLLIRLLPAIAVCLLTSTFLVSSIISLTEAREITEVLDLADVANGIDTDNFFFANDTSKKWEKSLEVNLFEISYDNEKGETVIKSEDGTRVVAPGASGTYVFQLNNNSNVALDCVTEVFAHYTVEDWNYDVPVEVQMTTIDGRYLAGYGSTWVDADALNGINEKIVLGAKHYTDYRLAWRWPFNENDVRDTLLGNKAVTSTIKLTIGIKVVVTTSADPYAKGGSPHTGDTLHIVIWASLCVISLMVLIFMIIASDREKENEQVKGTE